MIISFSCRCPIKLPKSTTLCLCHFMEICVCIVFHKCLCAYICMTAGVLTRTHLYVCAKTSPCCKQGHTRVGVCALLGFPPRTVFITQTLARELALWRGFVFFSFFFFNPTKQQLSCLHISSRH